MLRWTISVSLYVVCCDCISLFICFLMHTSKLVFTTCNPSYLILDHCLVWCINVSTLAKKNPSLVFSCPYYSITSFFILLFWSYSAAFSKHNVIYVLTRPSFSDILGVTRIPGKDGKREGLKWSFRYLEFYIVGCCQAEMLCLVYGNMYLSFGTWEHIELYISVFHSHCPFPCLYIRRFCPCTA